MLAFLTTDLLAALVAGETQRLGPWLMLLPLAIVGLIDDSRSVPPLWRFLVQSLVAGVAVTCLGSLPLALPILGNLAPAIALLLSGLAVVALINFYNFMDGSDGLVASVTALQLGFLAVWLAQPHLWLLVAALLGFLCWNWSPAKIFMGDVGSTFLGAVVAIALLQSPVSLGQLLSALGILLPLVADAACTLIRRLLRRENIFQAHRQHLYQRLQQAGWSHAQVAIAYLSLTLLLGWSHHFLGAIGSALGCLGLSFTMMAAELYLRPPRPSP